jgi:hypothetical protein
MATGEVPFRAHIELLQFFLSHRDDLVERIQEVLNAQRKPVEYLQDSSLLSRQFEDCFFTLAGVTPSQSRLRGRLEQSHWAGGFKPKPLPGLHNGLVEPAEMMIRAFHLWRQTRWPGRNGRLRYAHTLFHLYVIRDLTLLTLRVWDGGADRAGERLSSVQGVLDQLWTTAPVDQPRFVRDARWLMQMAQSPATDELGAYFEVAEKIAGSFSAEDRIAIHTAGVRLAAGHLRSQIRYYSTRNTVPLDEHGLVLSTRNSNALDFALLVQDLVPLLEAYERARQDGDVQRRLTLADTICQGVSPDPELFLNRIDLLGAYSMIEHLFITIDNDGNAVYSAMGRRHVRLLQEYDAQVRRVAQPLSEDCSHFRPVPGACSPYGVLYGFASDLIEHMALKATQPDAITRFGLEDVFVGDGNSTGKLAWVNGWRNLPHLKPEVARLFDYPQQFAEDVFGRIEAALRRRASGEADAVQTGRVYIWSGNDPADAKVSVAPQGAVQSDRREGKYLVSYETAGGWLAISKNILTEVLATGDDARITGLPPVAIGTLRLMCPAMVVVEGDR